MSDHSDRRTLLETALLALVYVFVSKLGLSLGAVSGFATLVWPSTGLALAALLRFGSRLWPGVFAGALVVNLWIGAAPLTAVGIATGNTLEASLGAHVMRRYGGYRGSFDRIRHVVALILGAAMASTLVSATIGVSSLALSGVVRTLPGAVATLKAWWLGDALGDLVVAPLLLTWTTGKRPSLGAAKLLEALALFALLIGLTTWTFFRRFTEGGPLELPFTVFPVLVWAALRFGMDGATVATAVTSFLSVWGTARGTGPFARPTLAAALVPLQSFMACAAVTPLVVAGALLERAHAVRVRDSILATVSHDLRNPIQALRMSAEMLLRRIPDEPVQRHRELINRCADGMSRLLADLLDASALDTGQLPLERRPEDIRELAREAIELARPLAPGKNLALEAGSAMPVSCDRERILQVLSNVLGNALRFAPEGTQIRVRVAPTAHAALVSVKDEGPGIEEGELAHVFERFWRTRSTRGGTGLGLFIAKHIVEAHGGTIWVESAPGSGATFFFTIPTHEDASERRASVLERIRSRLRELAHST